jgi:hypothetical protein
MCVRVFVESWLTVAALTEDDNKLRESCSDSVTVASADGVVRNDNVGLATMLLEDDIVLLTVKTTVGVGNKLLDSDLVF